MVNIGSETMNKESIIRLTYFYCKEVGITPIEVEFDEDCIVWVKFNANELTYKQFYEFMKINDPCKVIEDGGINDESIVTFGVSPDPALLRESK